MARSETVTNGKIHSMPNNDNYDRNYDAIFRTDEPVHDARTNESIALLDEAARQYSEDGMVDLTVCARLLELGLDISDYT